MKLKTAYRGRNIPFEGDRPLMWGSLPVHAQVRQAIVRLRPTVPHQVSLEQTYTFGWPDIEQVQYDAAAWGMTRDAPSPVAPTFAVDFHGRRTLAAVQGVGTGTLQVDLGGALVNIAPNGTIATDENRYKVALAQQPVALPGLTVNKLRLLNADLTPLRIDAVTICSIPTNVSLRLGDGSPFWRSPGEMAIAQTSPDFAQLLNTWLAEAATVKAGEQFYQIPLILHSDTLAEMDLELEVDYIIEQRILPASAPTLVMPYGLSTVPGVAPNAMTLTLPRAAVPLPGRSRATLLGRFESSRIAAGALGEAVTPPLPALVAPPCALAQRFKVEQTMTITGIDLPLASGQPELSQLHVAIQQDYDGQPAGVVLAEATVKVEKPLPDQSPWGAAPLATPLSLERDTQYWLILQSLEGQAEWQTQAVAPATTGLHRQEPDSSWQTVAVPGGSPWVAAQWRFNPPGSPLAPAPADSWTGSTIPVEAAPGRALAQPFQVEQDDPIHALAVHVARPAPGPQTLMVAIHRDGQGQPATAIASTAVSLTAAAAAWVTAHLPTPLALELGRRYWLVLTSDRGAIAWSTQAVAVVHSSRDNGLSWQPLRQVVAPHGVVAAQFRLRQTPDRFTMPLQLQLGRHTTARRFSLKAYEPLGRVEFDLPFGEQLATYLADAAGSPPSDRQERLVNGWFDHTPHRDATRRLFGFDVGKAAPPKSSSPDRVIRGVVKLTDVIDLSVERFISLVLQLKRPDGDLRSRDLAPPLTPTIDCRGVQASQTRKVEIIAIINATIQACMLQAGYDIASDAIKIADEDNGYLRLSSQQLALTNDGSEIVIIPHKLLPVVDRLTLNGWDVPTALKAHIWGQKLFETSAACHKIWPRHWQAGWQLSHAPGPSDQARFAAFVTTPNDQTASLDQTVTVSENCAYQLQFAYCQLSAALLQSLWPGWSPDAAHLPDVGAAMTWEVEWLDPQGKIIKVNRQQLTAPIYRLDVDHFKTTLKRSNQGVLELFETTFVAPAKAVKATLRFTQSPPGILVLSQVSFQGQPQPPANAAFHLRSLQFLGRENLLPAGWQEVSAVIGGPITRQVSAGTPYELVAIAHAAPVPLVPPGAERSPTSPAAKPPLGDRARLTLTWLGTPHHPPLTLPLDDGEFAAHIWRGVVPAGVTQAQITLLPAASGQPPAWVEAVTLTPVREAQSDLMPHWQVERGSVDALPNHRQTPDAVRLRGDAFSAPLPPDTPATVVSQTVAAIAGCPYQLQLLAHAEFTTPTQLDTRAEGGAAPAQVEVQWFANGTPIAAAPDSTTLKLGLGALALHTWQGTAPATATHAQVRLQQMPGPIHLRVEAVTFAPVEQVSIPLMFLAEAPGELTVSNLQVAYDLPESESSREATPCN